MCVCVSICFPTNYYCCDSGDNKWLSPCPFNESLGDFEYARYACLYILKKQFNYP